MEMPVLHEFSRCFSIADLNLDEAVLEIAADAEERAALARRFGLVALDALAATVRLKRVVGGAVRLCGRFTAEVVQDCVVTLEPVAGALDESIEVLFAPAGVESAEVDVVAEGEDMPEPLSGDAIDVGEVIAEHLGLALDPYPRRPGVVFEGVGAEARASAADPADSPFAALQNLKREV
ncbi:MAG: DUF177 domain-containing protein [Alphaproteobacteria bacterium]